MPTPRTNQLIRGHRPGHRSSTTPSLVLPDPWVTQAACTPEQADRLFFADADDGLDPAEVDARHEQARAVCATCPVLADCLTEAVAVDAAHGRHGVWAGLTVADRTPAKPKRNRARSRRRTTEPRTPIRDLSDVEFDTDVMRFADQGVPFTEIAARLNRSLRDVELARNRALRRRARAARRTQRQDSTPGQVAA